jgi:UDP-N-acetylglucosamine 2-epimerase (non-hydrolysing)
MTRQAGADASNDLPVVDLVAGARPNFVKLASVHAGLCADGALRPRVVHTGQHHDPEMSDVFFQDLALPAPNVHLGAGSASRAVQVARVLERYDARLRADPPRGVVVFGDVNGTLAAALAASGRGIPLAHVEAGLRSFDRTMPEEVNRVLTDALSDLFFLTEPSAARNLAREGRALACCHEVGNTMIDTLRHHEGTIAARRRAEALGMPTPYGLVTLHRPANVDDPVRLGAWMKGLRDLARRLPLVFPVHPRTADRARRAGIDLAAAPGEGWHAVPPQAYLDHLSLLRDAAVILTDSGGMQVEAAWLRVPCVVLRPVSEHVAAVEGGACRLAPEPARAAALAADALAGRWGPVAPIDGFDGRAGTRIAAILAAAWAGRRVAPAAARP